MIWRNIKQHLMTGISYMIPVVVAGGFMQAIAKILGGALVGDATNTIPWMINSIGAAAMGLVIPIIAAYVAYSIADRAALAPGFIMGMVAVNIKSGFIGGVIAAFLVGYFVKFLKKNLKVPKPMEPLIPVMIIPLLSTLVVGLIMYLVIGNPIAWAMDKILAWMNSMQGASKFTIGALIGGMLGFDMGGPMGKTASMFANALMADGIYGPEAAKIIGGMSPGIGVALSVMICRRKKYSAQEVEAAKAALPLGLCFITEGVLPFALNDPLRVIPASSIGSAVAAGLAMAWGCESTVPHGGIFVVPIMTNPMMFMLALLIGSCVTAAILTVLKPQIKEEAQEAEEAELGEIKMNF